MSVMDVSSPQSTVWVHTLPRETVDYIIDHLHDDSLALSSSSLVCRAWLPSSRYHLFDTIHCNPASSMRTLPHLYDRLLASPDVRPYIKSINVSVPGTNKPLHEICVEDLERVLSCLPHLQNLALRRVSLSSPHTSDVSAPYVSSMLGSRRLQTLLIQSCVTSDGSFHPLCGVLGLFAELDELTIEGSTSVWDPFEAAIGSPARLRELARRFKLCRALRLSISSPCPGDEALIDYLLDRAREGDRPGWPLQELVLVLPRLLDDGLGARLIRGSQLTLQNLFLDMCGVVRWESARKRAIEPAGYWRTLSINDCPLECITVPFYVIDGDSERANSRTLECHAACLAVNAELVRRTPPTIVKVCLVFKPMEPGGTFGLQPWDQPELASGWRSMDDALMGLQSLGTAQVLVYSSGAMNGSLAHSHEDVSNLGPDGVLHAVLEKRTDVHEGFFKRMLPKVYEKGMLYIGMEKRS